MLNSFFNVELIRLLFRTSSHKPNNCPKVMEHWFVRELYLKNYSINIMILNLRIRKEYRSTFFQYSALNFEYSLAIANPVFFIPSAKVWLFSGSLHWKPHSSISFEKFALSRLEHRPTYWALEKVTCGSQQLTNFPLCPTSGLFYPQFASLKGSPMNSPLFFSRSWPLHKVKLPAGEKFPLLSTPRCQ